MAAPEKIYIFKNLITNAPDDRWLSKRSDDADIEYIRTDTFIEKAVGRLRHYLDNSAWVSNDVGVREKEIIIADFVNYLEGE